MNIMVVGAGGMLSSDLVPYLNETGHTCKGFTIDELDITNINAIRDSVDKLKPDVVVNCAAYTNVDKAETERDLAMIINALGVQNLCIVCNERDIPLCHISTDYVFGGPGCPTKKTPYNPFDETAPVDHYGFTKLAGEKYVTWLLNKFYIIRTSWLYGKFGNNFVKTMLRLSRQRSELTVVADQTGSPTWTVSLSEGIRCVVESGKFGIYHVTDETDGGISWHRFAVEILKLKGITTPVRAITTAEFPTAAKRPAYSVLDLSQTVLCTGFKPVRWETALENYLKIDTDA
ncbi:MAG: dTDP-4-dehydrorhamnose reductase [Nitrospirae bacterium]|nr:dTDP-4-dehydrorhamnose reductase [Nitrospirota bacterium]MBF0534331.1 dTDP-4-dehydrorhamnose reductase [Nitrospirota bacterium]MBF0615688.1 dTDP-4-dehydrorhamnose reductase [Nitrospirota bacterium]